MKPFVRDLINLRNLAKTDVLKRVRYRHRKGRKATYCVTNALEEMDNTGNICVCGWAVSPYDKDNDIVEAMFHYWNFDTTTQTHYDTTPLEQNFTYVVDWELNEYDTNKKQMGWAPTLHFNSDHKYIFLPNYDRNATVEEMQEADKLAPVRHRRANITHLDSLDNNTLYDIMSQIHTDYQQMAPA